MSIIVRTKAPLRIGLAGGGTDLDVYSSVYGGSVLNASISLYVHCNLEETDDGKIVFISQDSCEECCLDYAEQYELDGVMDLYKGIYNRIVKDFNLQKLSFRLSTYSDVASGSGLGGSSTLVVSVVKAFVEWLNLPLGEYDIAKLAFEIERQDVGIVGGAQDQYAATFGGFNFMEFYENHRVIVNPLRIKNWIIDELEASSILYYTNIRRQAGVIEKEKEGLLKHAYALDAMHEVKRDAVLMKEALLKGDMKNFALLLGKSWLAKKKVSSMISNDFIDKVYNVAVDNGAISGKVSGAGGGGFMYFIVDPAKKYDLVHILNKEGGYVVNFSFTKYGSRGWRIQC